MRDGASTPRHRALRLQIETMVAVRGMKLLAVEHEARQDAVLVRVKGDVDSSTVGELAAHLTDAVKLAAPHPGRPVVIDLQAVDFFGSAALNAMLDCHLDGKTGGTSVRLVADHAQVLRPIQVTELDSVLDIYPTVAEALQGKRQR